MNDSMESVTACVLSDGINSLLDRGIGLADERGKETFGELFSITGEMNWSQGVGRTGELDMVTPFSFAAVGDLEDARSASFMQQGVTRWRDGLGAMRNDFRHGVVHRFRSGDDLDSDVVGISSFYLHSAEHGHEVLALGIDWFGRWGTGELRCFAPTTGWTMARPGHEERPLEGVELGTWLNLTTTLDLSVTGYWWENEDGSVHMNRGTRMGINWRPHPWLSFDASWDGGSDDGSMATGMHLSIPLGPGTRKLRWGWFGVAGSGDSSNTDMDLYWTIPQTGQIRVASRSVSVPAPDDQKVRARFVEPAVDSGEEVTVEVFGAESAQWDITWTVWLKPGTMEPSAVPGEDYVDQPVEATIVKGTTSIVVSVSS